MENYSNHVKNAIHFFWKTRDQQTSKQKIKDAGTRGAVTGGKQMDGFIKLLTQVCIDIGVPEDNIKTKSSTLPGYFRPTKNWDFLVFSKKGELLVVVELKSQVGSFGNNFNNRTEESVGSSTDLWTAFREGAFKQQVYRPWAGYLVVVEKCKKSITPVGVQEPYFPVFEEYRDTSYLDRYGLLCEKLMLEKLYDSSSLIWTSRGNEIEYGDYNESISVEKFINSLQGYLIGKRTEF